MEINAEKKIEKHLNSMAKISLYFQLIAGTIAVLLITLQPTNFKIIGEGFSIGSLIASFIIARAYIYTGKKLENLKQLSIEEKEFRKKEYCYKFFCSYPMWVLFYFFFSTL